MKRELYYFDLYPKVVPVGKATTVTVKIMEKRYCPPEGTSLTVKIIPLTEIAGSPDKYPSYEVVPQGGVFTLTHTYEKEQEYGVYILLNGETFVQGSEFIRMGLYALEPDLYALQPLKGDFHVHSTWSDGREMPEAVMARYREAGYDFAPITDHYTYESSVVAQDFYKDVPIDFNIILGEEIHAPGNNVHVVNFGGAFSVCEKLKNNKEAHEKEVAEIAKNLDISFDNEDEKFKYASTVWVFEEIRKGGGLAIFPHPHWTIKANNVRDSLSRLFFQHKCFDAFELIGGHTSLENNRQTAFYYDALREGYGDVPILGCSDTHGVISDTFEGSTLPGATGPAYPFTDFYTIVFATANEKNPIIHGVKEKYSVAVETYQGGTPRVHGSYRLVSYASFLIRDYFPLQAELCREEGRLMRRLAYHGDANAKAELTRLSGQVAALREKYFR